MTLSILLLYCLNLRLLSSSLINPIAFNVARCLISMLLTVGITTGETGGITSGSFTGTDSMITESTNCSGITIGGSIIL